MCYLVILIITNLTNSDVTLIKLIFMIVILGHPDIYFLQNIVFKSIQQFYWLRAGCGAGYMRVHRVYYFSGSIGYTQFSIPDAHQDIYPLLNGLLKKGVMN